jgi:hypothetical protein
LAINIRWLILTSRLKPATQSPSRSSITHIAFKLKPRPTELNSDGPWNYGYTGNVTAVLNLAVYASQSTLAYCTTPRGKIAQVRFQDLIQYLFWKSVPLRKQGFCRDKTTRKCNYYIRSVGPARWVWPTFWESLDTIFGTVALIVGNHDSRQCLHKNGEAVGQFYSLYFQLNQRL